MAKLCLHQLPFVFVTFHLILSLAEVDRCVYIVYMGDIPKTSYSLSSHHFNMLQEVVNSSFVKQSFVKSYTRSFNGFAAYLTAEEKQILADHDEVVSIFRSRNYQLHTTRSWDFVGFPRNVKRNLAIESDTIIGVIDTGIWPESESFSDKGFGPPPKKWKGVCDGGLNFTCNNKLIGARYYTEYSARDLNGHGSHTAPIAAGGYVKDVSFYGLAKGTARGGVPAARLVAYKACGGVSPQCSSVNLLASFDDAIADGVDIISMSIGDQGQKLEDDVVLIGSLHAFRKGILLVQSAGNNGYIASGGALSSYLPWVLTVAASHTDRAIVNKVVIHNRTTIIGKGVNTINLLGNRVPVVFGINVSNTCNYTQALGCDYGCIQPNLVKGKILLCKNFLPPQVAAISKAMGVIMSDRLGASDTPFFIDYAKVFPIAESLLRRKDFDRLFSYFTSTSSPSLDILASESIRDLDVGRVASFSSRGPNPFIPGILKPDVAARGIEIIAAYSPIGSPSQAPYDRRSVKYNIISGTSMACPHVSGAAAYVKTYHPSWSPSAIKSALMTTAKKMDSTEDPLEEFSYGAGLIDPVKAVHPGLVYETTFEDYVKMLCSVGYNGKFLKKIFKVDCSCSDRQNTTPPTHVNLPSMTSLINTTTQRHNRFSEKFTRVVTNVGFKNSTYKVKTSKGKDYNISVRPKVLRFKTINEKRSFKVTIGGKFSKTFVSASLEWSDGIHNVRSPIVIYTDLLIDS